MQCPNCGQELMNVNGRYVCINCGTEVPESQVMDEMNPTLPEITPTAQTPTISSSFDQPAQVPTPTPDPIVPDPVPLGDTPVEAVPDLSVTAPLQTEEKISDLATVNPEPEVSGEPSLESVVADELNLDSVTPVPETEPSNDNQANDLPVETPEIEPVNEENQAQIEQNNYSVAITSQQETEDVTQPENPVELPEETEVAEEKKDEPETEIIPEEMPVEVSNELPVEANTEQETEDVVTTSEQSPADDVAAAIEETAEVEAPSVPVEPEVPETSVDPVSPNISVDSIRPSQPQEEAIQVQPAVPEVGVQESVPEPQPVAAPVASLPQEDLVEPVATPVVPEVSSTFSPGPSMPPDPQIFQDPIFDQYADPDVGGAPEEVKERKNLSFNPKRLYILIGAGVFVFLLLVIGGIVLYNVLTAPAKVAVDNPATEAVDCGQSGPTSVVSEENSTKATSCITEKFAACSPAKYSSTVDLGTEGGLTTYAYEIKGTQDSSCAVETQFTKNANSDLVGKTMTCLLDSSKSFDQAVQESTVENCQGDLADLFFGTDTGSTEGSGGVTSGN